jgi:hypothetical protein
LALAFITMLAPERVDAAEPRGPFGVYDANGARVGALVGYDSRTSGTNNPSAVMIETDAGNLIIEFDRSEFGPSERLRFESFDCSGPGLMEEVPIFGQSATHVVTFADQKVLHSDGPFVQTTFNSKSNGSSCDLDTNTALLAVAVEVADLSSFDFPFRVVAEGLGPAAVPAGAGALWLGVAGLMLGYRLAHRRLKAEPNRHPASTDDRSTRSRGSSPHGSHGT